MAIEAPRKGEPEPADGAKSKANNAEQEGSGRGWVGACIGVLPFAVLRVSNNGNDHGDGRDQGIDARQEVESHPIFAKMKAREDGVSGQAASGNGALRGQATVWPARLMVTVSSGVLVVEPSLAMWYSMVMVVALTITRR